MKSYLTLALKELKIQKVTTVLILLAVILSTIMTTAIGQSIGILQFMRIDQASNLNGDRYATFHQLTKQQMSEISSDTRLFDVGSLINIGYMKLGNSGLTLFLREYKGDALDAWKSIAQVNEGRLPSAPNEIALPKDALKYISENIRVGDKITLDVAIALLNDTQPDYKYIAEFIVTGILESSYNGYVSGTVDAVIGEGSAERLLPDRYLLYSTDLKTKSIDQFQSIINDLAEKLNVPDQNIQYNWVLLDALGASYDEVKTVETGTGFSFMAFSCVLVGMLVLFAAGLVIYNILKISVTKRIRDYGTIRAIGGERTQIYLLVSLKLLILCGIGIPIGLMFGVLSAKGILTAATGILNPDLFMAGSTSELNTLIREAESGNVLFLIMSILITLIFAMLAAFPAAWYASFVSPIVAMSGQTVKIKRRVRKIKKIRNFEAYYARLNLRRGRGRTAITILSLIMSITVFVTLQSFTGILDTSSRVKDMYLGDYSVTNETIGFDSLAAAQILGHEAVESIKTTKLSVYTQNDKGEFPFELDFSLQTWESFQIAGIDNFRLSSYVSGLSEKDIQELLTGDTCIVKNPFPFSYEGRTVEGTNLEIGDVITVNGKNMRVAGIADNPVTINNEGFVNGIQIIVNDELYNELTGQERYLEVYPVLRKNADAEKFEQWLASWCDSNTGSHFLSYRQSEAELKESFEQINMLCFCLILFIGLIGILNIINTVYSNIHTRIAEIGVQRAIGMSAVSLYKTFLWEGAYYGLIASVLGGVLGYICSVFVNIAVTSTLQLENIPYFSIIEAAAISVTACLLATVIPFYSISKMNIAESIETAE